jgi:hypothetical protein
VPELRVVHAAVNAAGANQLLMSALLGDAVFGHDDAVGVLNSTETVRDDKRGAPRIRALAVSA